METIKTEDYMSIANKLAPVFIDCTELTDDERIKIIDISKDWVYGKQVVLQSEFIKKFKPIKIDNKVYCPPTIMPEEIKKHLQLYGMCSYQRVQDQDIYLFDGNWYVIREEKFFMIDLQDLPKELKLQYIRMIERIKDQIMETI